jgi:signal peptidase I
VKRTRVRSGLLTAALVLSTVVAWLYLAPARIGGSANYVITHGISMEPRFHAGDLAVVRPPDHYEIGQIVAYHSTLLHVVVLHRIIARDGARYVFKGDNNNFIDPTHPSQAELIGALWLDVPHGGRVLAWFHTPLIAGIVTAVVALLLVVGVKEKRRRRNGRRNGATRSDRLGAKAVNQRGHGDGGPIDVHAHHRDGRPITDHALLIACAAAVAVFLGAGLFAFTRPVYKAATVKVPYTQRVSFGYRARASAGPVYPTGVLNTGDPIFLQLVHRLRVQIDYRLETAAAHALTSTEEIFLRLTGPGGWSRSIPVGLPRRFTGDHISTELTLDVPYLKSLILQVVTLTGVPSSAAAVAVVPQVNVSGTLAGQPVKTSFGPVLSFGLEGLQLQTASGGLTPSQRGSVATASTARNTVNIVGDAIAIDTMRWGALAGLLLAVAGAVLLAVLLKRGRLFEESARIQAQYGHMIVPIIAIDQWVWEPIDVTSIKALVRLAECSERLILHHQNEGVDTYLINDEGAVYRYRTRSTRAAWGEWSSTPTPIYESETAPPSHEPEAAPPRNGSDAAAPSHEAEAGAQNGHSAEAPARGAGGGPSGPPHRIDFT